MRNGMSRAGRTPLLRTPGQWIALAICGALGVVLFTSVDLDPEVRADFFFELDDKEEPARAEDPLGVASQVVVAVRADSLISSEFLRRLHALTEELRGIEGVARARSLTHGPEEPGEVLEQDPRDFFEEVGGRPFWSRLLLAPDRSASFVVLQLREPADRRDPGSHRATVSAIDEVLAGHQRSDFQLDASGVPYVSEHIRRRLAEDLRRFSIAAFVAFGLLVFLLFRSLAVLLGTLAAALSASFATFVVRALLGMSTDVLAPNLWTLAFILTLAHTVYLTARWQHHGRELGSVRGMREAIRLTRSASAWSMLTNLLGFGSLLFVEAKPLREFGLSGAIATAAAMACAYLLFPPFLHAADPGAERIGAMRLRLERACTTRHPAIAVLFIVAALAPAVFILRIDTDPGLPRYFGQDSRIRDGIEAVDHAGGSSPLDVWVADASGGELVGDEAFERLEALHYELEDHPDVGSALSIALLMAETQQPWYSFLIPWEQRLQALESSDHDEIGRAFITEDRRRGRYVLRMQEEARSRPRQEVVAAVLEIVRQHGFEPVSVGGLYPLQGELSRLVETSVERSLGALLIVFCVIAFLVVRSVRAGVAMAASLALMPFALFGCVGLFRMSMEFLSAPAANIALALGIDESIHLAHTARRRIREGAPSAWDGWKAALAELWYPIVAAMLIVGAGFSLFLLSNFPPTRHLGLLVALGVVIANLTALLVLPTLASRRPRGES